MVYSFGVLFLNGFCALRAIDAGIYGYTLSKINIKIKMFVKIPSLWTYWIYIRDDQSEKVKLWTDISSKAATAYRAK